MRGHKAAGLSLWVTSLAGLALGLGPAPLPGQDAAVSTALAGPFIGQWSAIIETPQGMIRVQFDLIDDGGLVIGHFWDSTGRLRLIEEITMSGSDLLLSIRMELSRQTFRMGLLLRAMDDRLAVVLQGGGAGPNGEGVATPRIGRAVGGTHTVPP